VLQCAALCYSVLQCASVCCSVLQYVAVRCSVLHCVALCMLQSVAVRCNTLPRVAVCYNLLTYHLLRQQGNFFFFQKAIPLPKSLNKRTIALTFEKSQKRKTSNFSTPTSCTKMAPKTKFQSKVHHYLRVKRETYVVVKRGDR